MGCEAKGVGEVGMPGCRVVDWYWGKRRGKTWIGELAFVVLGKVLQVWIYKHTRLLGRNGKRQFLPSKIDMNLVSSLHCTLVVSTVRTGQKVS